MGVDKKTRTKEKILLLDVVSVRINVHNDIDIRLEPFLGCI